MSEGPDLEAQLRARTEELAQVQARLVHHEKMSSLGRLVAGIAHELNNPINFIYGNVDFLGDYLTRLVGVIDAVDAMPLPADMRAAFDAAKEAAELDEIRTDGPELVRSIRVGAERTAGIVADLRTYSRATSAELSELDVAAHIASTLHLIAPLVTGRIDVRRRIADGVPRIVCNPGHVGQVLMNLLANAAQAIVGAGWIEVGLRAEHEHVVVTVCDSGPGLAAEVLAHLGEPFFTTKAVGDGTGLGLWITDGVVRAHGGTMRWSNRPGAGAEFEVRLPLRAPETARHVALR